MQVKAFSKKWNDETYWSFVRKYAEELEADGCSGVPEFYRDACLEHDIHYRTGNTMFEGSLTKDEADRLFQKRIRQRSLLGWLSPMAVWRYWGVRWFGGGSWKGGVS